jgi:hypothetical protein
MSMAMFDKKKMMQTIMARRRDGKGEIVADMAPVKPEVMKDQGGMIDECHVAAQDILAAIHGKSPDALMRSLINFMDIYEARPHEEPLEQEE